MEIISYKIPQVLLISFAILLTLSLAVLTVSASAKSDIDTCTPAAEIPTIDAVILNGSAITTLQVNARQPHTAKSVKL